MSNIPLGEEPDTSKSLAATIKLAAAKGYISKETVRKPVKISANSAKYIAPTALRIEEKQQKDNRLPGRRNQLIEVEEPEYKPEINLEYTDDSGQRLDTKEAFRHMCHKFHGKGPGKNKIDKRLKKLNASKSKFSSSAESTLVKLMVSKQKELKSPHIILK